MSLVRVLSMHILRACPEGLLRVTGFDLLGTTLPKVILRMSKEAKRAQNGVLLPSY